MKPTLAILKALADGNRLRILAALLQAEELCACQLIDLLGVSGATTSQHLTLLAQVGLVESRKQGRWNYFRLGPAYHQDARLADWLRAALAESPELAEDRGSLRGILCCPPALIASRVRRTSCC
jgi:ArsR family transcriptional regulator